ncbi:hypothetical protein BYT27DRAFT_7246176 [Phlegmacium glaucopus]|nr:hypothetical protein BYT27DRAFT_7246176 [Phlegmacium glaucopus]
MLTIPSLVLVLSFIAQATVLAVPVPLNDDVLMDAREPSAIQVLVTRALWGRADGPVPTPTGPPVMPPFVPPKLDAWSDNHLGTKFVQHDEKKYVKHWNEYVASKN